MVLRQLWSFALQLWFVPNTLLGTPCNSSNNFLPAIFHRFARSRSLFWLTTNVTTYITITVAAPQVTVLAWGEKWHVCRDVAQSV
jgi:hypothetical protein